MSSHLKYVYKKIFYANVKQIKNYKKTRNNLDF